jgi:hypothetical protein
MSDACLKKLENEWENALTKKDYVKCAKILRAQINLLKCSDGELQQNKGSLADKVNALEVAIENMACDDALSVIGHIRYARKTLSLTTGDFGAAFKREIGTKERANIRKRNRPPKRPKSKGHRTGLCNRAS